MRYSEEFRGDYFKASDLSGKLKKLTIATVSKEKVGEDQKLVIRFEESEQGLVLNKTNGLTLAEKLGDDMDDWVGNPLILKPEKATFNGRPVDCIRVSVPMPKSPTPKDEQPGEDDLTL